MIVNLNKIFGLSAFIISSLLVIFIVSIPSLAFLRVPLYLLHTFLFFILALFFKQKIYVGKVLLVIAVLLFYVLIQNLLLQEDWLVIGQSVIMVSLLFIVTQIAQYSATDFYQSNQYIKLSKFLFFLLPFFCVSFLSWTETRQAGLFMNPNITGHLSVMILPYILLGLKSKKAISLAMAIALIVALITASRSTLMALLLSCGGYIFIRLYPRVKFPIVLLLVLSTTVPSS